jgi:hypothetical protein
MTSMSHSTEDSQDHGDDEEIVLGVDTHKDTHVAAVITMLGFRLSARPAVHQGLQTPSNVRDTCWTVTPEANSSSPSEAPRAPAPPWCWFAPRAAALSGGGAVELAFVLRLR